MEIIGLIRFSLLTKNPAAYWELARSVDQDDFERELFSEHRMRKRFQLFEALTLPSLDAQHDKKFKIIIMTSDKLPQKWRERLSFISNNRDYLHIKFFNDSTSIKDAAFRSVYEECSSHEPNLTFRIDDDDALHRDFVGSLREGVSTKLVEGSIVGGEILTFPKGIYLKSHSGALKAGVVSYPLIGLGLSLYSCNSKHGTVFSLGNHYNIDRARSIILRPEELYWIRSVYDESDSQTVRDVFKSHVNKDNIINSLEVLNIFRDFFPFLEHQKVLEALS